MASEVVQTTAAQVTAALHARGEYQFRLVAMDELTLRVHRRRGSVVYNTDVRYDRGPDTYTVKRYRITDHGLYVRAGEPVSDVYADQLGDLILEAR